MLKGPKKPCAWPGCRQLLRGERFCQRHLKRHRRDTDRQRSGSATRKLYDHRWRAASKQFLEANPFCAWCPRPSTVVDHRIPHRGNPALFWDTGNWQQLCTRCHNKTKQSIERRSR